MQGIGKIIYINGPVVKAEGLVGFKVREMILVGEKELIGEIIALEDEVITIQVYEDTNGLKIGEEVRGTGNPLSITLGPGIIGNIFDGIERPLSKIYDQGYQFIPEGIGMLSLDKERLWETNIIVKSIKSGDFTLQINNGNINRKAPKVPQVPGALGRYPVPNPLAMNLEKCFIFLFKFFVIFKTKMCNQIFTH